MPKSPQALSTMPPGMVEALRSLGENLSIARKRRKESIDTWASRIGASVPTIRRMERGDPSVGMGIYATALWMIGQVQKIPALAAPEADLGALEEEVRAARQRSVRRPKSIEARLAGGAGSTTPNGAPAMIAFDLADYQPTDLLYLWWLGTPATPRLIGELKVVRSMRGVSLRYADSWIASGFAISEDCPLMDLDFLPTEKDTAVGAVDDARPDRWGERVIRLIDKPERLSLMEYLFYAGDERFGAVGVSVSGEAYIARAIGPLPGLADVAGIEAIVEAIVKGEAVPEDRRRLIAPGVTMGGARPKALLEIAGEPWILKFAEQGEDTDTPLIEHATMTLAAQAGIDVAHTMPIALSRGHAVAVRRFDRIGELRVHALSARVALKAAGVELGYPELAQVLRRRGNPKAALFREQMTELFDRMVFNILIDNTDDHEKNHVLLLNDAGQYELSPAFDVLPSGQALGYQQMRVGKDASDSTIDNAMSEHAQFGLKAAEALERVRQVASVVDRWKDHFASCGVSDADIDSLARQIDRPHLRNQRIHSLKVGP